MAVKPGADLDDSEGDQSPIAARTASGLTRDFTPMPPLAQAEVHFVGGTDFTVWGLVGGAGRLLRLVRRMRKTPNAIGPRLWYRFPLTVGSTGYFSDMASLRTFTESPEHLAITDWARRPGTAKGGFVRIFEAAPVGTALGGWLRRDEAVGDMSLFDALAARPDGQTRSTG